MKKKLLLSLLVVIPVFSTYSVDWAWYGTKAYNAGAVACTIGTKAFQAGKTVYDAACLPKASNEKEVKKLLTHYKKTIKSSNNGMWWTKKAALPLCALSLYLFEDKGNALVKTAALTGATYGYFWLKNNLKKLRGQSFFAQDENELTNPQEVIKYARGLGMSWQEIIDYASDNGRNDVIEKISSMRKAKMSNAFCNVVEALSNIKITY